MALDLTTAVTGVVIGGFTTPGYTLSADTPPTPNSKQSIVSALTGTQTNVRAHSVSDPFTITVTKPLTAVPYPQVATNGTLGRAGRNKYTTLIRKGTIPLVGQAPQVSEVRIEAQIVAGADVNDAANLAAMWSLAAAFAQREAANYLVMSRTGGI